MAFAVHVNMNNCTGCNNCVVACPVNALELNTVDPATTDKIYCVINGRATSLDVDEELCAGCGICIEACPYDVITLEGKWVQLRNEERFTHPTMEGLEDIRDYEEECEALEERQASLKKFPEFWELRKEFTKSGAQE
jgi:4Fe-4S ferredoxin